MHAVLLAAVITQFSIPDTDVARAVVREYPQLATERLTELERIRLIRQFCWSHVPSAGTYNQINQDGEWNAKSADEQFAVFERTDCGVMCGGKSQFHAKLLRSFGFKAFWVSCGSAPGEKGHPAGHSVTLVELSDGRQIISDVTFGMTLADRQTKEPLDFFEILSRLKRREHDSIIVAEDDFAKIPTVSRQVFTPEQLEGRTFDQWLKDCPSIDENRFSVEGFGNGRLRVLSVRSLKKFVEKNFTDQPKRNMDYKGWVVSQGYPPNIMYVFARLLNVHGTSDAAKLLAKGRDVQGRQ